MDILSFIESEEIHGTASRKSGIKVAFCIDKGFGLCQRPVCTKETMWAVCCGKFVICFVNY